MSFPAPLRFVLPRLLLSLLWVTQLPGTPCDTAPVEVTGLRCEGATQPLGIDTPHPRLSWRMQSAQPGAAQTAYQIEIEGIWDTGKVGSPKSLAIPYAGPALASGVTYRWRVRVWDQDNRPSHWSPHAAWTMGKLQPEDWSARWITAPGTAPAAPASATPPTNAGIPALWFRNEFNLPTGTLESALVTVQSASYFELHVNGEKIGAEVLAPAVSDARLRTFTLTYDVAQVLRPGKNCIGLWAARGWSDRIALRAQLDATVAGQRVTCATGPEWKTHPSELSHIGGWQWGNFGGERIDARLRVEGWARPGISLEGWSESVEAAAPGGHPVHHHGPLNRIGETLAPRTITPLGQGRYEIDFGTNLTGWLRLRFRRLPRGRLIRMHFADCVFPDGRQGPGTKDVPIHEASCVSFPREVGGKNLYQSHQQVSEFISAGEAEEEFRHRFNYAGFRYVVIEGLEEAPLPGEVSAMLVESALQPAGTFECSDPLLNRIHAVNRWTMRCLNLGAYYVDCPHRERMGYGDGQVALQGMMMNFDASAFYEKWAADWRLALDNSEKIPYIAPAFVETGGGPAWPGNIVLIPWWHYLHYGDPEILKANLPAALRYCEKLDANAKDQVLRAWGEGFSFIGDWVPPGRGMDTQNWPSREMAELFSNCYRIHLWSLVARMADALGQIDTATHARGRADTLRAATHAAFFNPDTQQYVADEQIYYAFPLLTGVAPEALRPKLQASLLRCLERKNRGHLDTGMLGTLFLIEYLAQAGRDDLVLALYQKKGYPGWGHMVTSGATTFWEQWNGYWSQIHSCFTSADNWLYHGLAGIRPDPRQPGFRNVLIQPAVVGDITWVKATHQGPHGPISVHWRREGNQVLLEASIPPNSTATVMLPGTPPTQIAAGRHHLVGGLPSRQP